MEVETIELGYVSQLVNRLTVLSLTKALFGYALVYHRLLRTRKKAQQTDWLLTEYLMQRQNQRHKMEEMHYF